ncbi:amidohydrolase family protein [Streptomyces indonesiensis]
MGGTILPDQLRLIVAEAARHGLRVAAHAHGTDTIAHCVAAGVRTLEHCSWRTADGIVYDPEIARSIVENDVAVCRCVSGDWRLFMEQMGPERSDALIKVIQNMREAGVQFISGTDAAYQEPGSTITQACLSSSSPSGSAMPKSWTWPPSTPPAPSD